jgi:hypothetical protein
VLENLEWDNETLAMLKQHKAGVYGDCKHVHPKQMVRRGETGEGRKEKYIAPKEGKVHSAVEMAESKEAHAPDLETTSICRPVVFVPMSITTTRLLQLPVQLRSAPRYSTSAPWPHCSRPARSCLRCLKCTAPMRCRRTSTRQCTSCL